MLKKNEKNFFYFKGCLSLSLISQLVNKEILEKHQKFRLNTEVNIDDARHIDFLLSWFEFVTKFHPKFDQFKEFLYTGCPNKKRFLRRSQR